MPRRPPPLAPRPGLRIEVRCDRCGARSDEVRHVEIDGDVQVRPPEGWSRCLFSRGIERLAMVDTRLLCTRCTNGLGRYLAGRDVDGSRADG